MASNPCPCGYLGSSHPCICPDSVVSRYRRRLSGPILDRIDLHLDLHPTPPEALFSNQKSETSHSIRTRVSQARAHQHQRRQSEPNGRLAAHEVLRFCVATNESQTLLESGMKRHRLSARAAMRILKVSRTIADLDDSREILPLHIAEALGFRPGLRVL